MCVFISLVNIVIMALEKGNLNQAPPALLGQGCYFSADFNGVRL